MDIQNEEKFQRKPKSFKKGMLLGLLIGISSTVMLAGMALLGYLLLSVLFDSNTDSQISDRTVSKIKNIEKVINNYFYEYDDEVGTDELENGIYEGMLASLNDQYSEYYSKEELTEALEDYEGISYGIGCYVTMEDDMPVIYGVMEASPAEEAGVKNGDIITKVNDESVLGLSLSQVVERIKGPENSEVTVIFLRDEEYVELKIKRGKLLENTSVYSGILLDDEDIGYIRIKEFDENTEGQFKESLDVLKNEEHIKALVIDLRSNPGGNLNAVVEVARDILPEGIIVYTKNKKGVRKDYTCDGKNELDIPLVVLVNEYSASASEILAGAIKDHQKGTLIGTTTYGKGIVQSVHDLGDGTAIKLTSSAYFTPSDNNIQGKGIEPDIVLEFDEAAYEESEADNQVEKAIEVLRKEIAK